jgi:hypothetical protein
MMTSEEKATEIGKLVMAKAEASRELALRREQLETAAPLYAAVASALSRPDDTNLPALLAELGSTLPIEQLQTAAADFRKLSLRLADLNEKLRQIGA